MCLRFKKSSTSVMLLRHTDSHSDPGHDIAMMRATPHAAPARPQEM